MTVGARFFLVTDDAVSCNAAGGIVTFFLWQARRGSVWIGAPRRCFARWWRLAVGGSAAVALAVAASGASAQDGGQAFKLGDFAASGFSGVTLQGGVKPGVDPVTKTVIDPNGISLRIFDGATLGGPMAGQAVAPPQRTYLARDIGQVFGLAMDPRPASETVAPALYAAATSAFGLPIVGPDADGDGKPDRLTKGARGATFMEGLFGAGGGPGTIWKIDQATGTASRFADVGGKAAGAALGGLAIDAASGSLYASDLDTGLVHRFALSGDGASAGTFDHGVVGRPSANKDGVSDDGSALDIASSSFDPVGPQTWAITQPQRRVDALAVNQGRLFYSVAEGPEIWSVGLEADGSFKTDARFEVAIADAKGALPHSIAFDANGRLIVAERAAAKPSADFSRFVDVGPARVLRFDGESPDDPATPGRWLPVSNEYAVGTANEGRESNGGVAMQYAYSADGSADTSRCGGTLVVSAAGLGPKGAVQGVHLVPSDSVRDGNGAAAPSAYVAFDPASGDVARHGAMGGVAALQTCSADGFPPVAGGGAFPPVTSGGGVFPPVTDGGVVFPPVTDDGGVVPPPVAPVSIVKTATGQACAVGQPCSFNVTITNSTAQPLPGPIEFVDEPTGAGGVLNVAGDDLGVAPPAPWTCDKGRPTVCEHPGPLPAGGSLDMPFGITPRAGTTATSMTNCATLRPPRVGGLAPAPQPSASERSGLRAEMKALSPSCGPNQSCEYELVITNTSAQPKTGSLKWTSNFGVRNGEIAAPPKIRPSSVAIESVVANPAASCDVAANDPIKHMTCLVGVVTLAPQQSYSAKVKVRAALPPEGAPGHLENTASIQFAVSDQTFIDVKASASAPTVVAAGDPNQGVPQKSCATIPITQPQPSVAGALSITKTAGACRNGRACDFTIAVTNTGDAPFNGPVAFSDTATGDGALLGSTVLTAPPPWSCPKAGQSFACTGTIALQPKQTLPFTFTADLGAGIGAVKELKNCARLEGAAQESCATGQLSAPPPVNAARNLVLVQSARPCVAKAQVECGFDVTIANVGTEAFKGPLTVESTIPGADGLTVGVTTGAPWSCPTTGGDGVRACSARDVTIPSNSNIGLPLTVTVPLQGNTLCKLDHSAKIVDPAGGGPLNSNAADDVATPVSEPIPQMVPDPANPGKCLKLEVVGPSPKPIPTTPPPPTGPLAGDGKAPNIAVAMAATTRFCAVKGTSVLDGNCKFVATFTNKGEAEFEGVLRYDVTSSPRHVQSVNLGSCTSKIVDVSGNSPQVHNCETDAKKSAVRLSPGSGAVSIAINVEPGDRWVKNNVLKVCVRFSYRSTSRIPDPGTITSDDEACAEIMLDPFSVAVEKTGDAACPPGSNCSFKIKLFNPGPIDHDAPVTISDGLSPSVTAPIVSISPRLPCAKQPTSVPFVCTSSGPVRLDLGAPDGSEFGPRSFTMVVKMPADGTAKAYTNCISVAGNEPGAKGKEACHTVTTKPMTLSISKQATSAYCDETTPCSFKVSVSNASASPVPGPIVISDLTRVGSTPLTKARLVGGPNEPWACAASAAPGMQCTHPGPVPANGSIDLTFGWQASAAALAGATEVRNCAALAGESAAEAGACAVVPVKAPVAPPPETAQCGAGMVLVNGACECPPQLRWNGSACVGTGGPSTSRPIEVIKPVPTPPPRPTERQVCPSSRPVGTYPNCCPRGMEFRGGSCRAPVGSGGTNGTQQPCAPGQNRDPRTGVCFSCSHNDQFVNGKCVPKTRPAQPEPQCPGNRPVGKFPNCCPVNAQFINGRCNCQPGFEFRRGQCVQQVQQPPPQQQLPTKVCPDGSTVIGKYTPCPRPKPQPTPPVKCPPSAPEGTPPNCRCPAGTVSRDGFCRPATCGPNMTGVPPNCNRICPPGTVNQNQSCVPVQKPKPPPAQPQKQPCPKGWDGDFFPNCFKPPA